MARLAKDDLVIETKNPTEIVRLKADGFREDAKASMPAKTADSTKAK